MQRLSLTQSVLTLLLRLPLLVFHFSSAFSYPSVPGTFSSLQPDVTTASRSSLVPSFLHPSAPLSRLPLILTAIADRETTSSDISDYGRIFPSNLVIVEPRISPLGASDSNEDELRRRKYNKLDKDELIASTDSFSSDDDQGQKEEEGNHAKEQDSRESNDEEDVDDEEKAQRRTKASILKKLAGSSSSSSRSRKNISESKERRNQKETSVGKRRVGTASKARSRGGVGKLLGSVRRSAAAAATLKEKNKKKDNDSSPSSLKDRLSNGETNKAANDKKSIVSTIKSLIDAQDDAKYYTKQPYMGILGERVYYDHPRPKPPTKYHKGLQQKQLQQQQQQQQQQESVSTLPKPGTIIMQQKQQLAKHTLIARQYLRKHFSISVASQSDYAAIAQLRLSVYGGNAITWKKEWIDRTCEILNQRRLLGITCLTACVNYVDARPWLIGSIECSTHEFEGTNLEKSRPPGAILYITEVAVSNRVRRSGIGLSLVKAMDKIATIRNVETLYLHVDVENIAARSLYEQCGYEVLDSKNKMYAEFTRKLNLHNEGTTGRRHHLMHKKLTPNQTWYSKSQRGTIGFDVSSLL